MRRLQTGARPENCPDETCGVAHAIPFTRWTLVPATVWTDCCRRGHQLYDPKTRKFLRLRTGKMVPKPSTNSLDSIEFLWLCPMGDALVTQAGVVPLNPPGALRFGDADACLGGQPIATPSLPCPEGDQCEEESGDGPNAPLDPQ